MFFLIPLALGAVWAFAQGKDYQKAKSDELLIAAMISDILENGHFSPKHLNDEVSEYAYEEYLKRLDFNKLYVLESDVKKLDKYKTQIDDELKAQKLEFYFKATDAVNGRIEEVKSEYEKMLDKPFDFDKEEKIELDPEKRDYFSSKKERTAYWKLYLKYLTMNRLANKLQKQNKDREAAEKNGEDFEEKSFADLEAAAREQVKKNMNTRFERRAEVDAEDQFASFINSVAAGFGPHSQYFPPQEKENFDMRLTGRLEGIGAQLSKEGEYIKVVSIVPGSASWRQGELKENDLILKVAQGADEPVDVVDATMKEAIKMIRGPKDTEVRLTVQKPDGEVKVIPIIRDVVVQEETYAKSAMIESKNQGQKIGYVYLPSFYFKPGGEGRSCAEDVQREVEMLESKGASGIILDLRNNGGGSLDDAVQMVGNFIEKGPVVQVKDEERPPRVKKDRNEKIGYDGPLIVMVNNFSASASEILAGALKDYERAVIVGNTTLGKGTVQSFVDLNRMKRGATTSGPLGAFKLTIQQFYRINGASTQLKGVRPDIMLPDMYGYMETGMRSYKNALPFDSIQPLYYGTWDVDYDLDKLRKNSKKRVGRSEVFDELSVRNKKFKKERDISEEVISVENELKLREERKAENKAFEELFKGNDEVAITSLQEFNPDVEEDVKKERLETWEKQLTKDFYLNETIFIMEDMLAMMN